MILTCYSGGIKNYTKRKLLIISTYINICIIPTIENKRLKIRNPTFEKN